MFGHETADHVSPTSSMPALRIAGPICALSQRSLVERAADSPGSGSGLPQ